ncbi:MAG: hypothetical protein CMP91_12465 [Gammaproteobacteria bacterium]|nr:hypothetical protein [Gammaproteobacteria bacterium]|tara:strand:- start:1052 stop:2578 length:1527 start_codon:yes stop_codon:yes gene_type:complete
MKVLFGAHGSALKIFHELDARLRARNKVSDSAYWISDSSYYFNYIKDVNFFDSHNIKRIFEWEHTCKKGKVLPGEKRTTELLKKYGMMPLWNAIVADRRLMYGEISKYHQDYDCKFDQTELESIIISTLHSLDLLITNFKPDVVATFVPASFGDYLLALIAKANNIKYMQLRSTKISNFVTFSDSLSATFDDFEKSYLSIYQNISNFTDIEKVDEYIKKATEAPIQYEGTINAKELSILRSLVNTIKSLAVALKLAIAPVHPIVRCDNHVPPPIKTWLYNSLLKPLYKSKSNSLMTKKLITLEEAAVHRIVFYPLHSEPEIALSIYGRDHQNQIETIRRIAQSIPLGWTLVVKEHPRSYGYRSANWYKKLLNIPNVKFAPLNDRPFFWIRKASAIITVSGFVGFESIMLRKPVIVLGDVAYSILPKSMVKHVGNISDLQTNLQNLIKNFSYDEFAVKAFVATCMKLGEPVNLYSQLLAKKERSSEQALSESQQYDQLTYLFERRSGSI